MPTNRIALVTGVNQGMGKQAVKELEADNLPGTNDRAHPGDRIHGIFFSDGATRSERGSLPTQRVGARVAGPFQAVQGDTSGTCVDWQAFHFWQAEDPGFTKVVTVLDDNGDQQTVVNWPTPTDRSADISLERMAWQRVGPWAPDGTGRRSATVRREPGLFS